MERRVLRSWPASVLRKRLIGATTCAVGALCLFFTVTSEADAQTRSTEAVRADLKDFADAFLDRPLSEAELTQVTREFVGYFGAKACEARCMRALASHKVNAQVLRTKRGQPEELILRHIYVATNYFDPKMRGTLILRHLTEPDPVRVVDPDTKRLMTERDVVALVNLQLFLQSRSEPIRHSMSPEEIDKAVEVLERGVGIRPGAGEMPMFFGLAATFWAGLQREWPRLNAKERQAARDYIQHMSASPMPVHLYGRLLGVSDDDAHQLQEHDKVQGELAEIRAMTSRAMDALGGAVIDRSVIQGMQDAIE